jgi:hypothetical protein
VEWDSPHGLYLLCRHRRAGHHPLEDDSLSSQVGAYNPATNQFALNNLSCGVHPHDGLTLDPALQVWWDEEFASHGQVHA